MRSYLLLLFGIWAFASGCEEAVDATDLPYADNIVVSATLKASTSGVIVHLSHTLPMSNRYTDEAASIPDARATITVDGKSYPLIERLSTNEWSATDLPIESGKRYELTVDWRGKHATAETVVPYPIQIDTFRIGQVQSDLSYFYGRIELRTTPGEDASMLATFGSEYTTDTSWNISTPNYSQARRSSDRDSLGYVWVPYEGYVDFNTSNYKYELVLYAFDPQFYSFAESYYPYDNGEIFGSGGSNPQWNVKGDGIGMFIGMAETDKPVSF